MSKNFKKVLNAECQSVAKRQRIMPKLVNWFTFTSMLVSDDPTESETLDLLAYEWQGAKRPSFLIKLHQRYTTLRRDRERAEIGLGHEET